MFLLIVRQLNGATATAVLTCGAECTNSDSFVAALVQSQPSGSQEGIRCYRQKIEKLGH
jgi:hypothetical protein